MLVSRRVKLLATALDYLLIIEVIISTEPDHHAEAEPLVHFVVHAITVHGGIRGAVLH